jgi:hypothetical protein
MSWVRRALQILRGLLPVLMKKSPWLALWGGVILVLIDIILGFLK